MSKPMSVVFASKQGSAKRGAYGHHQIDRM